MSLTMIANVEWSVELKAIAEDRDAALALEKQLASDGKAPLDIDDGEEAITLERDMVSFKEIDVVIKGTKVFFFFCSSSFANQNNIMFIFLLSLLCLGEVIQPYVIEPAFGIGRILYAIFEHRFRKRDVQKDTEKRNVTLNMCFLSDTHVYLLLNIVCFNFVFCMNAFVKKK